MITYSLHLVLLTQLDSHLPKYLIFNSRYNKIYSEKNITIQMLVNEIGIQMLVNEIGFEK